MKVITRFIASGAAFVLCACVQYSKPQQFHSENFNWSITIPENFTAVGEGDWKKMQDKGTAAMENTLGEEVINEAKTIFVFKNGKFNYLEANYQPFDAADGDYDATRKDVNAVLFGTFQTQIPGAGIDSVTSVEQIGGLQFHVFKIKIDLPNKVTMRTSMYSRLFDQREFSVNITFVDDEMGEKMLTAWRESTFN
jgi:hypothetical protein